MEEARHLKNPNSYNFFKVFQSRNNFSLDHFTVLKKRKKNSEDVLISLIGVKFLIRIFFTSQKSRF